MFFRSIKFRLTLWYILVLALLLAFFGFISYYLVSYNLYRNLDNAIISRATEFSLAGGAITDLQSEVGEIMQAYNLEGKRLDASSAVQLDTSTITALINSVNSDSNSVMSAFTVDGQPVHLYATNAVFTIPSAFPGLPQRVNGFLVVGRPLNDTIQTIESFRSVVILGGLVTILLAAAGGFFLASRALKPVDDITRSAREIEESDLNRRIQVKSKDELGRLASTLNDMIARLEKAFERQRQFPADASHELRTPLAVIEAEATLALGKPRSPEIYQQSLDSITQEVSYMSSILEKLLMLARADAGREQLVFSTVNLKQLISGIIPDIDLLARDKGIRLEAGTLADLSVKGDETKLKQLLLNLLDNAIKYTPDGSISLSLTEEENHAVTTVADTGIGIPAEHISRIFERFYRVDKARSRSEHGTGLGLSIVKFIVEAHGGKIVIASEPGKGSTFRVFLPLAPEE